MGKYNQMLSGGKYSQMLERPSLKDTVSSTKVDPVGGDTEKAKTTNYLQQKGYEVDLSTVDNYRKKLFDKDASWQSINKQLTNELSVEPTGPSKTAAQWLDTPEFDNPEEFSMYMDSQRPIMDYAERPPDMPKSIKRLGRDVATGLGKGVVATAESLTGLSELLFTPSEWITGGRSITPVKMLRAIGYDPSDTRDTLNEFYSPETLEAQAKVSMQSGVLNKLGTALQNPSVVGTSVVESALPMMLGASAGAGMVGSGVVKSGVVASALGEGLVSGGMMTSEISDYNEGTPLSPSQAGLVSASMALTTLISLGSGGLQKKLGITDVDVGLTTGNLKGGIKQTVLSAFFEGFIEELPQSVGETISSNLATDRPWDEGIDDSAALGILTGIGMGTAGGFVGGLGRKKSVDVTGMDKGPLTTDDIATLKEQPELMENLIPSEESELLTKAVSEGDGSAHAEYNQKVVGVETEVDINDVADVNEIVGISREEKNIIREAQGVEVLDEATRKAQAVTMQQAKAEGLQETADILTEELLVKPRTISDTEVGGMLLREAQIKREIEGLYEERNQAMDDGDTYQADILNRRIESMLGKLDDLTKASALAGTELGRALASMGMKINQFSYELVDLMNQARTTAGRPLTEKESGMIEKNATKIKELQEKIAEVEQQREDGKAPEKLTKDEAEIRRLKAKLRHKIFEMRQKTAWDRVTDVADFARAMKLSFDMGYFGRQGGKALFSRPSQAVTAMRQATSTLFSDRNFYTMYEKLKNDPDFADMTTAGLEIMDIDAEFERHQEAMNSPLAERFPWVRASNRHMVTGLNMLRSAMFKSYKQANPDASMDELRAWAKFTNEYTGRGTLGGLEKSAHTLTNFLLAPRWVTSNWQTVAAERHAFIKDDSGKKVVNKKLLKTIAMEKAKFFSTWMVMAGLFKMIGFDVGEDPEKSDFMKFSKGDLKIDLTAGQAQNFRLLFLAAESTLANHGLTDLEENADLVRILQNYGLYKTAPLVTVPLEYARGKNLVGDERSVAETTIGLATPIILESAYQEIKDDMDVGDILTAASMETFGVGAQIYDNSQDQKSRTSRSKGRSRSKRR